MFCSDFSSSKELNEINSYHSCFFQSPFLLFYFLKVGKNLSELSITKGVIPLSIVVDEFSDLSDTMDVAEDLEGAF